MPLVDLRGTDDATGQVENVYDILFLAQYRGAGVPTVSNSLTATVKHV